MTKRARTCIDRVPDDVPVGMHLCYGDYGHQHFKQPEALQMQVDVVDAVNSAARRPVNFISFTVPQGRNDSAYFEPLAGLETGSETELYFALVPYHPDEQAPGTAAEQIEHIDAALLDSGQGAVIGASARNAGWVAPTPPTYPACSISTPR